VDARATVLDLVRKIVQAIVDKFVQVDVDKTYAKVSVLQIVVHHVIIQGAP